MNRERLFLQILYEMNDSTSNTQQNNPLHGVKLLDMLELLIKEYSWEQLATFIDVNCFRSNPSLKSCLKFFRKTPWARAKVEKLYLDTVRK